MLRWAIIFLVVGAILIALGFGGVGGAFVDIGKFLGVLFLIIFVVLLVLGLIGGRKVV